MVEWFEFSSIPRQVLAPFHNYLCLVVSTSKYWMMLMNRKIGNPRDLVATNEDQSASLISTIIRLWIIAIAFVQIDQDDCMEVESCTYGRITIVLICWLLSDDKTIKHASRNQCRARLDTLKVRRFLCSIVQHFDIVKPNLSLYSPYYANACNEFEVPISAS